MQPNQPSNQTSKKNPYFFLNETPESTKSSPGKNLIPSKGSMKSRILLVGSGLIFIIIVVVVINSIMSGAKNGNQLTFANVVQDQSILLSIADSGTKNSATIPILNLSGTTKLAITRDQGQLLSVLRSSGVTISSKDTKFQNPIVNSNLSNALLNGGYNGAFLTNYQDSVNTYLQDIQKAYPGANPSEKKVLDQIYNQGKLLLEGVKNISSI